MRIVSLSIVLTYLCILFWSGLAGAEEMVQLSGNHPSRIVGCADRGNCSPSDAHNDDNVKVRDPEGLNRLLSEQQDPNSPNYQKWLTPQEFSARFGPDPAQFKAVRDWLIRQEFEIVSSNP